MPKPTIKLLKYGNTNTYFIKGGGKGVLIDTDWAGTLPAFFKEIKRNDIKTEDIGYVLITHYHPDHMGIAGELENLGIKLLVPDVQRSYIHCSDEILRRNNRDFTPVDECGIVFIACSESRNFPNELGIGGEIIHTPGHSDDSVSLVLDEVAAFVGDLDPFDVIGAFDNQKLRDSWELILSYRPKVVYYGHANERHF